MSSLSRGGRGRQIIAGAALTILAGTGLALLAAAEDAGAGTPATGAHAAHADVLGGASEDRRTPGSDDVGPRGAQPVVPPASTSAGNVPQRSLEAAAGTATRGGDGQGRVSVEVVDGPPVPDAPARNGAEGLGEPRADVSPTDVHPRDAAPGGCAPAYGTDGQCLPAVPPSQADHVAQMRDAGLDPQAMTHPWTCGEVRQYFAEGLAVRVPGVDPDGLDSDKDGWACEPD